MENEKEKELDKKEKSVARVTMNCRRHLNVLFSDLVRPWLLSLGESLERTDLDRGLKSDQVLHELVAGEFNKSDVDEYNDNAFPYLVKGRSLPPSHFQPIDWTKSKQSFKDICREYDTCFKAWKQSGFHDKEPPTDLLEMTEVADKPFEKFSQNSSSILYMHEYMLQFPSILDKVTGKSSYFYINSINNN